MIAPLAITPRLLSLKQLENRHRRVLRQLMTTMMSGMVSTSLPEVKRALLDEAIEASGLGKDEVGVMTVAIELRAGCRKGVESGVGIDLKQVMQDLERRE